MIRIFYIFGMGNDEFHNSRDKFLVKMRKTDSKSGGGHHRINTNLDVKTHRC